MGYDKDENRHRMANLCWIEHNIYSIDNHSSNFIYGEVIIMDIEFFWCLVGNRVQSHFLYSDVLTIEEFKEICKKIREKKK